MCWIPPLDEDDEDADFFLEFCQKTDQNSEGSPYTVWITFKEGLSVEVLSIYFEAVTRANMIQFLHNLFVDNSDIIHRVEIQDDSKDFDWSISVESPSRYSH